MKKVLVTGANGQLGRCLQRAAPFYPDFEFYFTGSSQLNIEDLQSLKTFFANNSIDICINTAAYTKVEDAEKERELAFNTNKTGAGNIAKICAEYDTFLIHISTDYVFDGKSTRPYLETDAVNPINVYGESKLAGEHEVLNHCPSSYIIRTSWLYSEFGHNFYNSVRNWASEGRDLTITTEQLGVPTNANDLAAALLEVAAVSNRKFGIYHYSNEGEATWYDFAEAILSETGQISSTNLAKTEHYRTFAARPKYSVLDTTKFKTTFHQKIPHWRDSLKKLIKQQQ